MQTASQIVRIERHDLTDGLSALTYADPALAGPNGEAAATLPLVFVLHGLGSRKERHLDLCLRLANAGFRACAVDARHHGDRWSPELSPALSDRTNPAFVPAFAQTVRGTVEDVVQLANYFGAARYSVAGHSMGGFIAMFCALADKRIVAAVNVAGSISGPPTPNPLLTPEQEQVLQAANLSAHAGGLWPCALLLVHGTLDDIVPYAGARRLYEAAAPFYAADRERLHLDTLPAGGHEWTPAIAERTVAWLVRFLKNDTETGETTTP